MILFVDSTIGEGLEKNHSRFRTPAVRRGVSGKKSCMKASGQRLLGKRLMRFSDGEWACLLRGCFPGSSITSVFFFNSMKISWSVVALLVCTTVGTQAQDTVASAPLPLRLTYQHIGQIGSRIENVQAGGAGVYSVTASSADIWGTADSFQFGYQPLNGNGQIVARVLGMEGTTNGWAKAGVMIRETLDPHSRQAMLVRTVSNGLAFQWRAEPGGASGNTGGSLGTTPCWVKLIRYGNFVMGYESKDGVNWQLVDWQIVEMSQQVYAGVVVSSHDETSACTARFDHVQVSAVSAWDAAPVLGEGDGLRGDYFGNKDLTGTPLMVRKDGP